MKAKELLIPRFEVIETYPKGKFKKGDLLERIPNATNNWYNHNKSLIDAEILLEDIEKHPHLFKKLNWWENRKVEEMPMKLKSLCNKDAIDFDLEKEEVFLIVSWDMKNKYGFLTSVKREICDLEIFAPEYGYIPVD
ncbi:hypothetical protein [Tenacibaculum piscium]|uniref:hypothetical protein n=1 Tax=Tenacibaculum piscium TaxID=1458515 RepID=UPI001F44B00C|nr:hypothetical protein [Tenacibaculum piscium]